MHFLLIPASIESAAHLVHRAVAHVAPRPMTVEEESETETEGSGRERAGGGGEDDLAAPQGRETLGEDTIMSIETAMTGTERGIGGRWVWFVISCGHWTENMSSPHRGEERGTERGTERETERGTERGRGIERGKEKEIEIGTEIETGIKKTEDMRGKSINLPHASSSSSLPVHYYQESSSQEP